jgi:hypothetical protein
MALYPLEGTSGRHFDEAGESRRAAWMPPDHLEDAIAGRTGTHVVDD